MPIAPVLQRFVDDELARAPALIERTVAGTLRLLGDAKDSPLAAAERAQQSTIAQALQVHGAAFQHAFVQAMHLGVQQALDDSADGLPGGAAGAGSGLELMDESRVEIDIEISRAMQLIDTTAEWELRELQTFTSTLVGQTHVSAQSNPFRPLVVATALWQAACVVSPVQAHRTTLLRVSAGVAAGLLKNAWAAACTRLESQGVEPGIYRTVLLAPGAVSPRKEAPAAADPPDVLASLLASMPAGRPWITVGEHGDATPATGTPAVPVPIAPAPASAATPAASQASPLERQTTELLNRVFDAMAADPQVPAPVLALLARLQGAALRMALFDPEMCGSTDHPAWRLINRIGAAGTGHPLAGDPRTVALLAFCQTLIEQLGHTAEPDASLYRRALTQLDAFMADQWQAQLHAAQRAVQTLQSAERREVLEQRLAQRIVDQMVPVRTTPTVRRFMTGAWAKVLADAMLRDGDDAPTTRGYIKLVDELLWSVQLPDHPQSRQRLVTLLPSMLQRLRAGMEQIGLPAAEQAGMLDELMAIHTEALRPGRGEAATLTPEQIVQRMRNEVLPAATGHGGFTDSVIDLASMETVPADVLPSGGSAAEPAKRIEALRPGDRLRLFLQGRWSNVQLLWRSDLGLFFLFGGDTAARTHSVTHRALERLNSAGLVQPLETSPLLQRALDSLARELVRPG
ncbi:MAG: DUF1631 family protein [Burkholderiales bacterium]|nr:DUF1631 family protein [Burkholderiales bacterium]